MLPNKFSLISVFVLLIIWLPANAMPPQGVVQYGTWERPKGTYPWDMTSHPACTGKKRLAKDEYCEKGADWPDFKTTMDRVRRLLVVSDFELLSKAENELVNNSKRFPTGEYLFEAWNQAMKVFTYRDDDNTKKKFSEAWIAEQKGNGFSIMTRALLQYSKGVDSRYFNKYEIDKNTPEALENFRKHLKAADKTLESAPEKIKKTALWYEYKLKIAYQLPEMKKSANKIFKEAVKHWPLYPAMYTLTYTHSHPQYGGSYKAMNKVMEIALKNSKSQIGLAMYPMLVAESWDVPGFDFDLTYSKIDWQSMKLGFKDYEKHFGGSLKYFYRFAELACKNHDLETTKHFYQKHKQSLMERFKDRDRRDPVVVRAFSEENECRDWALEGKERKSKLTRLERQKLRSYNSAMEKLAKYSSEGGLNRKKPNKHAKKYNWDSYMDSKKSLSKIFSINDFLNDMGAIQFAEDHLGFSTKRFGTGEYYFEAYIDELSYHFTHTYNSKRGFENDRAKFIEEWIDYQKGNGYSTIVKAMAMYGKATDRFNSRYPKNNSPGTMINYAKYLLETNSVLESASEKIKQTAAWHEYKLKVAYQHPRLKPDKEKLLADAIIAWPEYPAIYAIAYAYSHPNWGGSYKEMTAIAKLAVDKTKKRLGAAMYPQVIYEARIQNMGFEIPYQIIDWDLMKKGFRDYQRHLGGNLYIHSMYLDTACKMGDKEEVRRVFPAYEKLSNGEISKSLESCLKFASNKGKTGKNLPPPFIRKPGV